MRYIDADLIKYWPDPETLEFDEAFKPQIDSIPTADVEPVVHAFWIKSTYIPDGKRAYVCSRCGRDNAVKEPYCNCGAKMDGRGATQ